jgi:hypothetical protein
MASAAEVVAAVNESTNTAPPHAPAADSRQCLQMNLGDEDRLWIIAALEMC